MKRHFFAGLAILLVAPVGFAIVDTNSNGLSDLWERAQNNGELLPSNFDPEGDPDADGWSNAKEAAAGTSPFDANPPDGMIRPEIAHIPAVWGDPDQDGNPDIITPEAMTVSWPTLIGKQYTLLVSSTLMQGSWITVDVPFVGNGNIHEFHFEIQGDDKLFWRVAVTDSDTDGDGLTDSEEHELGTDPLLTDTDGDEMPDGWEMAHGLNPNSIADAGGDPDGDGLTNLQEYQAHTHPNYYDTDGDEFFDGFELGRLGFDPLVPNENGDLDGDGLSDMAEITYGTSAASADSDADGFSDLFETENGSNPTDAQRIPFTPSAHFGGTISDANAKPMGNLGVASYGNGNSHKVTFNIADNIGFFIPGVGYTTNQEAWRLKIGPEMGVSTIPYSRDAGGPGRYPAYSNYNVLLQLDSKKTYEVSLQHLGLAGVDAGGNFTTPDYRHSWSISSEDFLILTSNPSIPVLRSISANKTETGVFPAGYDWTTRLNYLVPIVRLGYSTSYMGGDATGPRFRKISHFGRPVPDTKPEAESETDEAAEESYVDAFDLSLHHDNSFASIPLGASELRLEAAISSRESGWSNRSGLHPDEDITSPFGIGWSSNLCAYVEVVETLGNSTTRPTTVNVVDEGGRSQRFGTTDMATFTPWPSTQVDKKTYLNELHVSGDSLVLTKKFGNKLIYRPCASWFMYSTDRLDGSDSVRKHRYWRLEEVEDKFGEKVIYDYGQSAYSLIPATISANGRTDQKLTITRSANGRSVTSIRDAQNNLTTFNYLNKTASVENTTFQYPYKELENVTFADDTKENYTYEVVSDSEIVNNKETYHFHGNLKSIQRGASAKQVFDYEFDRSKKWYDYSLGRLAISADMSSLPSDIRARAKDYVTEYNRVPQMQAAYQTLYGIPRRVSKVDWPTLGIHSEYSKSAETKTVYGPQFEGINATNVTDATGKKYSYVFGGTHGEIIDADTTQSGTSSCVSSEWLVYYTSMTLSYINSEDTLLGTELFEFDPNSGFSLKRMVDISGNETSWTFGEARTTGSRIIPQSKPECFSTWADPTSKKDALGRVERYEYGSHRVMSKSTDVHGSVTSYTVDALGRRTAVTVTGVGGNKLQEESFSYENSQFPGFMTRKAHKAFTSLSGKPWEQDLVEAFVPDSFGRIYKETSNPNGLALETVHTYDANNSKLTTTDPNGNITTFHYNLMNCLDRVTNDDGTFKQISYDDSCAKISETDENGNATTFGRDTLGRVVSASRSGGTIVSTKAYNDVGLVIREADPRGCVTTTEYDYLYRPTVVTRGGDDASITETFYYGPHSGGGLIAPIKPESISRPGSSQSFEYDDLYRTTTSTLIYTGGESAAITHTAYNGLVTTITDPLGKVTVNTADGLGRVIQVTDGTKTSSTSYSSTGLPFLTVDPLNREKRMEYDAVGRATKVCGADPVTGLASGAGSPVSETSYDDNGNTIAQIDPLGRRTDHEYDSRNRRWRTKGPVVDSLDPAGDGRPTTVTEYDDVGNAVSVTDPRGLVTETTYDTANRPYQTTRDSGGLAITTSQVLDPGGLVLRSTDGNENVTINTYDKLGRLITTTTNPGTGGNIVVTNAYDAVGNLISVSDGKSRTTAFTYDGRGRKTSSTWDPGSAAERVETSQYNAVYQTCSTDAMGRTTTYGYDSNHRLITVTCGGAPGSATQNHTYSYDAADRIVSVIYPNAGDALRDTLFTYDKLDRLTSETSAGVTHTYPEYDKAGNRKQTVYGSSGTTLVSTYDAHNRLVTCTEGTRITSYGYDLGGKVTLKTLPNGAVTTGTFDKLGRTLSITERDSSSALVSSFDYSQPGSYDAVGNVLRCAETYSRVGMVNRVVTNSYDNCYRLLTETITPSSGAPTVTTYGYDKANNRTSKTTGAVTTVYLFGDGTNGANSNQLISYGPSGQAATHSFTYDANGNRSTRVTAAGTETLSWDHDDRLVSLVTSAGTSYSYGYDYCTRRVIRDESAAGGVKSILSFSGGTSVQEADSSGVVQAEFIRGRDWGGGVGGVLYSVRNSGYSFNAYNSRGDVVSTTDGSGVATWQAAYEAFGTRTAELGTNIERQRATTKDEDPSGLLNEGHRYRDLEAGVFISRDPLGFVDGPNVYTYVRQNPWTHFDPEGLWMQPVGDWLADKFGAPLAPLAFMARHSDKVTGTVHAINAGVSFVPGLGKLADGLDATISSAEGHYAEAALTAGGGKAAHLAANAMHATAGLLVAAKIVSHGEEVANVVKATEKTAGIATARTIAAKGIDTGMPHMPGYLPDSAPVLRGGQNLPENFLNGSGVSVAEGGLLDGVSVNSSGYGQSLAEIAKGIPHSSVGSTTVGEIRALGGDVIPRPTPRNPWHSILSGVDADSASKLMKPLIKNPAKTP